MSGIAFVDYIQTHRPRLTSKPSGDLRHATAVEYFHSYWLGQRLYLIDCVLCSGFDRWGSEFRPSDNSYDDGSSCSG